jgi:hypothetical protein
MLHGNLTYVMKGLFRDFDLITLVHPFLVFFDKPFKKDILVSQKGSLLLGMDSKYTGELLFTLLKYIDQLIPCTV